MSRTGRLVSVGVTIGTVAISIRQYCPVCRSALQTGNMGFRRIRVKA